MSHEDSRGLLVLKSVSSRDRDSDIPCRGFEYVQGYYRFDIFKADFKSIVAVHGLGGHREKSWTYEKDEERVLWLRDFLPIYVPDARIVTFGYSLEGDEILAAKIAEKAVELLDQVSSERTLDNSRSLIFIGHDIGGTIIKQALLLSSKETKYQSIEERTSLLVFFGCPHRAVDTLAWERLAVRLIFASGREYQGRLSKILEDSTETLVELSKGYEAIAGIYDTLNVFEVDEVDYTDSTWLASDEQTIPNYSAILDLPCETNIARQGPHSDICKFAATDNEAFRQIREKIYNSSEPHHIHVLRILSSLDCKSYLPITQTPKENTYQWVQGHEAYKSWLSESGPGILQLQGQPGSGRSVLASYLSSSLRDSLPNVTVIGFSFDSKDERHRFTYRMYASLCHQILSRKPILFNHVQHLCNLIGGEWNWTVDKLWVLFRSLVACPYHGTTICVLDGIDDCDASQNHFLESLLELPNLLRPNFKLLVSRTKTDLKRTWTLRSTAMFVIAALRDAKDKGFDAKDEQFPLTGILQTPSTLSKISQDKSEAKLATTAFVISPKEAPVPPVSEDQGHPQAVERNSTAQLVSMTIDLDTQAMNIRSRESIVKRKISNFLQKNPAFRTFQSDLERIMARKHISTLVVSLDLALLESLEIPSTRSSIQEVLKSLPDTLDEVYEHLINLIPLHRASWARKVVSWIIRSFRPLNARELAVAVALEPNTKDFASIQDAISQDIALDLKRTFGPLIKIENEIVFFMHNSFQDFLLKGQDKNWPCHFTFPFDNHADIVQTCLNYLSIVKHPEVKYTENGPEIRTPPGLEGHYDLLMYAVQYWPAHYRLVQGDSLALEAVQSFFSKETLMQTCSKLYWSLGSPATRRSASFKTPLPIAAEFGCSDLVANLLGTTPSDYQSRSMALEVAAYRGYEDVVRQLLDFGVRSPTALHMAASNGHDGVVKQLLEAGANVTAIDSMAATPLHVASKSGYSQVVDQLLGAKSDILAVDVDDSTPLHLASEFGHVDVMQRLLNAHADLSSVDKNGSTPLHLAVESQQPGAVNELLKFAILNLVTLKKETPLHLAAKSGRVEIIKMLLQEVSPPEKPRRDALNCKDFEGATPMHKAAQKGHFEVVSALLAAGADASVGDDHDCLPLHFAAEKGHLKVVKALLGVSQDHSRICNDSLSTPIHLAALNGHITVVKQLLPCYPSLDIFNELDSTPLHLAAANGHAEIVQMLLDAEAEADILNRDNETPLHVASRGGFLTVVKMLLREGSDPTTTNDLGRTPLHVACERDHLAVVKELFHQSEHSLEDEVFVNLTDDLGTTSLHLAASSGDMELFKELLTWGAELNAVDDLGQTLLHFASRGGNVELIERLLKDEAEVNALDVDKRTPLHHAAEAGHLPVVLALFEADANPNALDKEHRLPLHLASENGHLEIVKELLSHGAEIDARDKKSRTALHFASEAGKTDVVKALLEKGVKKLLQDDEEYNPLDRALEEGNQEVVDLLLGAMTAEELSSLNLVFALQNSAKRGQVKVVRKLLTIVGVDPGEKDEDGRTPLSHAAEKGYLSVVKLLLGEGSVNADTKDNNNRPPLSYAAEQGHLEIVRLLLDTPDPSPDSLDKYQRTALSYAAEQGHLEIVGLLLNRLDVDPNWKDKEQRTALSYAAENGHDKTVRMLLTAPIDLDSKCIQGNTALSYAAYNGHLATVKLLLSRDDVNPNSMDSDDRSVLWRAASEGHESIVRLLVERGADTNASDSDKTTILQVAASNGHANVVKALLDDGKVSDGNAKNDNKLSPMYEAAYYGHVEVIEELLKHHLDKEILGPNDWRPLHAGYDNADVVKRLLDAKAEVNAKTLAGATALALAASGDYENSISLLLDAGANPLSKDNDGNTPLHEAAKAGSAKVFKQLLEHAEGETDVENDMSETPLSLAAADGRLEIVRLLMERDEVNVTRKDNDGYTSLWSAAEGNHFGVVQALLEKVDVGSDEVGDLLVLAAEKEGQEILKLLFDKGARPKNQTEEDRLIQVAFSQGNRLLANGLVRIGVDPDKNDEHGWSLRLLTSPEDESNPDFIRQAKEKIIPPTSWSETDKQDLMELGEENMTVKLRESKYLDSSFGMIRANHPIPNTRKFYFEVEIIDAQGDGGAVIGFCQETAPLGRLPGWDDSSWGYHGDSGELFHSYDYRGRTYAEGFGKNDVVGCCVMPEERTAHFTRNGKRLPPAFGDLPTRGRLYPCVGLVGTGAHVRVHFGKQASNYDEDGADEPQESARETLFSPSTKVMYEYRPRHVDFPN